MSCDFEMVSYSPQPLVSLIDQQSQQTMVGGANLSGRAFLPMLDQRPFVYLYNALECITDEIKSKKQHQCI